MLPIVSKVLKKLIFIQLYSYFNKKEILYDNQYGFRGKYSTEFAARKLIDRIVTIMDKNDVPVNVFIDLWKAFATVDHSILQNKLAWPKWLSIAVAQKLLKQQNFFLLKLNKSIQTFYL